MRQSVSFFILYHISSFFSPFTYTSPTTPPFPSFLSPKLTTPTTENLDKSKITGISQVDQLQDSVNGLVSGQVGKRGLGQPLGDAVSKEGINRAERGGKDDQGRPLASQAPLGGYVQAAVDGVAGGAGKVGESVGGGGKGVGGWGGGLWGAKK